MCFRVQYGENVISKVEFMVKICVLEWSLQWRSVFMLEICVYVGDPCHRLAFTVEICVLVWSLRWRSVFYSGFYGENLF